MIEKSYEMINLKVRDNKKKTVKMDEMVPFDVGMIVGGSYDGAIVMRTASENAFEVMDISKRIPDRCWTKGTSHRVRLAANVKIDVEFN
jgi:hypothetical protein